MMKSPINPLNLFTNISVFFLILSHPIQIFFILFIFLNLRFTPENIGNSLILFLILSSLIYLIFTILFLRKPSVVK